MKKTLLEKLLDYYHLTYDDYLYITRSVSLNDLPSPFKFLKMNEAVELVKSHFNHKIVVYGDYDADGICGTSIIVKMFKYLNKDINYYIPSRYLDGYGINEEKAKEIISKNYDLVITVDNGIAAVEPIKMLREAGIDVLVLDHHEAQAELPDANVIIHPMISKFSETTSSSGAFTAFMFASAYLGYFDKYLSTLAAISLISDMMPLREYNRDLLRAVINDYKNGEFPQVDYLIDSGAFNEIAIGMSIAPKINAVGRLDKTTNVNRLIKYFISESKEEILSYKNWILAYNDLRKDKSKEAKDNIISSLKTYDESALVIEVNLEEGLLGLVANSLMNQLNIPVIVLTTDSASPDQLKGSARSVEGFNLAESFAKLEKYLINFGGHALAAGLTLKRENLDEFKSAFINLVKGTKIVKKKTDTIEIGINDINEENYRLVESFSPFGEEWKAPLFKIRRIKSDTLMYSKNQQHIITTISLRSRLIGFNHSREEMNNYNYIDIIGSLKINEFDGKRFIEFHIADFKESE